MSPAGETALPLAEADDGPRAEMERYGITRITVDYYHFAGFRYTSLKDAVAQAKLADAAKKAWP